MKLIQTHSEYSWSLLDPRPVLKYNEDIDEYIVYWNGVVMPHLMALNIAMEMFGSYPTPTMKARLLANYKRIYYTGGFGEIPRDWEDCIRSGRVYSFLRNRTMPHARKAAEGLNHAEVLGWFHYNRARGQADENPESGEHERHTTAENDLQ